MDTKDVILELRTKKGLSQLQDRRYPVGKTGNAVPNIDRLSELSHLFNATINEMLEDMDLLYELTDR